MRRETGIAQLPAISAGIAFLMSVSPGLSWFQTT